MYKVFCGSRFAGVGGGYRDFVGSFDTQAEASDFLESLDWHWGEIVKNDVVIERFYR